MIRARPMPRCRTRAGRRAIPTTPISNGSPRRRRNRRPEAPRDQGRRVNGVAAAQAAQRRALHPAESVWVAASAGTGKTKVLTDRLLALMLGGTDPAHILCLTFTRAAAAEMANRINARLAAWTTMPPGALAQELVSLTGRMPTSDDI